MSAFESGPPALLSNRYALVAAVAFVTALCICIPRIGPLAVAVGKAIVCVVLLVGEVRRNGWQDVARTTFLRPEIPFVAWVIIACLWSVAPIAAQEKALLLAAFVVHAIILSRHLDQLDAQWVADASKGLVIGFLIGAIYLLIEITLRDFIGRMILTYLPLLDRGVGKHVKMHDGVVTAVSGAHMSRVSALYCLLLCPAMLATVLYTKGALRWIAFGVVGAVSLAILLHRHSHSQTAEVALLVALVFVALAAWAPTMARWAAGMWFAGLLFLIVPVSLAMFAAKLHEDSDLFRSARARVVIWNYTSEQILENPILGVGTYSTRFLDEKRVDRAKERAKARKLVVAAQTRAHPHNVYLHVWYELGLIGAAAFALLGLSVLRRVQQLPRLSAIAAIGHFGICTAVIASTYGMWQNWFQAAIVLSTLVLLAVAAPGLMQSRRESRPEQASSEASASRL